MVRIAVRALTCSCRWYSCRASIAAQVSGRVNLSQIARTLTSVQAARYESGSQSQRDAGLEMIDKLDIKKNSSVLDLGCGTGFLAKVLSDRVGPEGTITAVDPDDERLKIAKEKYSAANIKYVKANDKTFPTGPYNVIICNVTIHWIADKEALFKRVLTNLHPGGQFAFTTSDGPPSLPKIGQKLFDKMLGPEFLHQMHTQVKQYLTAYQYKALATKAGFEYAAVNTGDVMVVWKNLDHYIESMHGWFGGQFDPAQFDPDMLLMLKKEYGDGPVELSEPIKKLEIVLTKASTSTVT